MIASFSFASTAHVTQKSTGKNTVNDLSVVSAVQSVIPKSLSTYSKLKQVGFTVPLFSSQDQQAEVGSLLRMEVILPNTSLLLNTLRQKKNDLMKYRRT